MSDALTQIRKDLGENAVILHTRTFRRGGFLGFGGKNVVEVTASGYSEVTTVERNVPRAATKVVANNSGRNEFPWGSISQADEIIYEVQDAHPESASVTSEMKRTVQIGGRNLVWQGVLDFRSDRENFYYIYTRRLFEGDREIREKTWTETIPRDFQ